MSWKQVTAEEYAELCDPPEGSMTAVVCGSPVRIDKERLRESLRSGAVASARLACAQLGVTADDVDVAWELSKDMRTITATVSTADGRTSAQTSVLEDFRA